MSGRQISRNRNSIGRVVDIDSFKRNQVDGDGITCVVCCHLVPGEHRRPIFAIGPCDHPVCYHCSTKMRILCEQNECTICRQEIPEVIFSESPKRKYSDFHNKRRLQSNSKYNIYFETPGCLEAFNSLLVEKCKKCKTTFNTVHELQDHLWEEHRLLTCGLCVQNLKIFSDERKYYNQRDLERHMKYGDPDDRSYQGHPACELCANQRYVDHEELNNHLRREHYYCHLCDPSKIIFYDTYENLNQHFRRFHFLCEEGSCKDEKFTSVFRSEIDLQAHRAQVHCLTKSEAKHARTLSLDLTFNPSSRGPRGGSGLNPQVVATFHDEGASRGGRGRNRGGGGARGGDRGADRNPPPITEESFCDEAMNGGFAMACVQQLPKPEDFPVLGEPSSQAPSQPSPLSSISGATTSKPKENLNKSSPTVAPKRPKHKFSSKLREVSSFAQRDDEEFPALCDYEGAIGGATTQPSSTKSISLAEAVKLKSKDPPKDKVSNNSRPTKSGPESYNRVSSDSKASNRTNPSEEHSSENREFSLVPEDFQSLPFKVNGNRKKKKALNILLASLNHPQPNLPPNYTSVRLVDSSMLSKEEEEPPSLSEAEKAKQSLEATLKSLLLKEENFPPLSEEGFAKSKKSSKKESSNSSLSKPGSSKASSQQNTFSSLLRPPPGYEPAKKNSNNKSANNELTLTSVAQEIIKPQSTTNNTPSTSKSNSSTTPGVNSNNKKTNNTSANSNIKKTNNIEQQNSKALKVVAEKREKTSEQSSDSTHRGAKTAKSSQNGSNREPEQICDDNVDAPGKKDIPGNVDGHYIYPKDFDERNRGLFEMVKFILKDRFHDFDKVSGAFLNDEISPETYYMRCVEMFRNKLSMVLLDLIVLLPDIHKQKQLLAAHEAYVKQNRGNSVGGPKRTGVWEIKTDSELEFVVCPFCGQVLSQKDGRDHVTTHQSRTT